MFVGSVQSKGVRIASGADMSTAWMMSRSARPIGEAFQDDVLSPFAEIGLNRVRLKNQSIKKQIIEEALAQTRRLNLTRIYHLIK